MTFIRAIIRIMSWPFLSLVNYPIPHPRARWRYFRKVFIEFYVEIVKLLLLSFFTFFFNTILLHSGFDFLGLLQELLVFCFNCVLIIGFAIFDSIFGWDYDYEIKVLFVALVIVLMVVLSL